MKIEDTFKICPKCGEPMLKDNIMDKCLVYADRLRCLKCGYWETRAFVPRRREDADHGIEIDLMEG